jgi:hypothetical protein
MLIGEEFGFLGTLAFIIILISTIRTLHGLKKNNKKKAILSWLKVLVTVVTAYLVLVMLYTIIFPD